MKIFQVSYMCLWVVILFISISGIELRGQQNPQYTQYMYNTMSINPAYAGSTGSLEANLLHRSQWVGVDGAPQTQNLGIHSPLFNERLGIGINIMNDKIGPSNELFISSNFSYSIQISNSVKLAFGLKAGAKVLNVDWSKGNYYDDNDVLFNNNIDDRFLPTLGAGGYMYGENWYVGLSVPNFIRADYYDEIEEAVLADRLHYFIIAGYVFSFSENLKFKPAVLTKIVNGAPISVDVSANFLISNIVTFGASYRWNDSVSGLVGFQVLESLFIGYAYDYSVTDFNKYNDGSHEIMLRYQLPDSENKIKSPRFF